MHQIAESGMVNEPLVNEPLVDDRSTPLTARPPTNLSLKPPEPISPSWDCW